MKQNQNSHDCGSKEQVECRLKDRFIGFESFTDSVVLISGGGFVGDVVS